MMNEIRQENLYAKLSYHLLLLAVATIPFTHFLMLPIAIALFLVFCIENNWSEKYNILKKSCLTVPFIIFSSLFLLYLIGIIYSKNMSVALSDIECKLWFFVAPLCIFPLINKIRLMQWDWLLLIFCLSTLAFALINMVISTVNFADTGDKTAFFYTNASHWQHPSYVAMYSTFSFIIALYFLSIRKIYIHKITRIGLLLSVITLPVYIFLLESKAGLLVFGLLFLIIIGILVNIKRRRPLLTIGIFLMIGVVVVSLFKFNIIPYNRIKESVEQFENRNFANPYDGTTQRWVIWKTSGAMCVENMPLGVGTGDVKDELCKQYQAKGYTYILERQLNCHNQYLQTWLAIGIVGLIALLTMFVLPLIKSIQKKDILLFFFVILVMLNLLVESMMETRAGANFIPLMLTLLYLRMETKQFEGK